MRFSKYIETVNVPENKVAVFWLGQAGFALKTHGGKLIAIDPYLTNYVRESIPEEGDAFKRLTAPLFDPDEIAFDILLSSHEHGDHFHMTHPTTNWRACVEHGEKLGIGQQAYELVEIK